MALDVAMWIGAQRQRAALAEQVERLVLAGDRQRSESDVSLLSSFTVGEDAGTPEMNATQLSRNVGQPDHILANPITRSKAERRPGRGEVWLAVTKHHRVQVDSILIDQAKFGEASRQVRASNFDLPVALGLQFADRALKIILDKPGVGTDRLQ